MENFAQRFRIMREKKDLTQAQIADKLGVKYQSISKWETGKAYPDLFMLPKISDIFECSLDELFGRSSCMSFDSFSMNEKDFLLKTYAQCYNPENGPWNLSVENKYLEFKITEFFEKNFQVKETTNICNIGIGAGEWDRYLSYKLKGGSLTSVDRLPICCEQLKLRLKCEKNQNRVNVICADATQVLHNREFEIVTMIGTTAMESDNAVKLFEKACAMVTCGGSLYYQTLDRNENFAATVKLAFEKGFTLSAYMSDDSFGINAYYYKFQR